MRRSIPLVVALALSISLGVAPLVAAPETASALLAREAEAAWQYELANDVTLRARHALPIERLPGYGENERRESVEFARAQLGRLAAIDAGALGPDERVTLGTLRWRAEQTIELARHAALDFQITPYALSFYGVRDSLLQERLAEARDADRYLDLVAQHARSFRTLRSNLATKRAAGVLLPRPEIDLVVGFVQALDVPGTESFLLPAPERLTALGADGATTLRAAVSALYESEVRPAYRELVALFDEGYRAAAPEGVGLHQYAGGDAYYDALVRYHTTLDLSPEAIHKMGLEMVEELDGKMAAIRAEVGFTGSAAEFHAKIRRDPRFLAKSAEEVGERLMAPIRAIEPKLPELFTRLPAAPYGVARLDPALEGSMTFGYYWAPTPAEPRGLYYFNGSKLDERPLIGAAALIHHELAPGHHFQIALQMTNETIPAIRRESWTTAFTEGWGEYASGLGAEAVHSPDPYVRYGRLFMEMFVTVRLVVDTGMNRMGWTRERASEFMRARLIETDTQIATETLRYSCDIPGQALAYEIGAWKIRALRDEAKRRLGARFDLRAFHDLLLATGAVPLGVLEERVEEWIAAQLPSAAANGGR